MEWRREGGLEDPLESHWNAVGEYQKLPRPGQKCAPLPPGSQELRPRTPGKGAAGLELVTVCPHQ